MTKAQLLTIVDSLPQATNEELEVIVCDGNDNIPVTDIQIDAVNGTELVIVMESSL